MDGPNKDKVFLLELLILFLFLVSLFASVWGYYKASAGQGCMDGLYVFYGIGITLVVGIVSLLFTLACFYIIRPVFRILGLLPLIYIIGLLVIWFGFRLSQGLALI